MEAGGHIYVSYLYYVFLNFSVLFTTKYSNENRYSEARGSILNLLDSSLQETLLYTCCYCNYILVGGEYFCDEGWWVRQNTTVVRLYDCNLLV